MIQCAVQCPGNVVIRSCSGAAARLLPARWTERVPLQRSNRRMPSAQTRRCLQQYRPALSLLGFGTAWPIQRCVNFDIRNKLGRHSPWRFRLLPLARSQTTCPTRPPRRVVALHHCPTRHVLPPVCPSHPAQARRLRIAQLPKSCPASPRVP